MPSIQINKTDVQVQMKITNKKLTPLEEMLDCLREVAAGLINGWLKLVQKQELTELIGAPYRPLAEADRALACPDCGSVDVGRKCWRSRTLKVAWLGEINLPRRQVCCKDCG